MFFQAADTSTSDSSKGLGKALEQDIQKNKDALQNAQDALQTFSTDILKTFTQGRERIFELQRSLVDALPNIRRLGGGLDDVSKIISGVAEASRRNVVASTEQIEKLFVLEKLVGKTGGELSESFLNVGIGIESIPEALQESIQYVQSIGGNAKTVFADVSKNMDQMNRFQFEDGVLGLTKMAAQASMMRFDVGQTLKFADDVLDPDRAIEVAGAFQRLGVAAGTLVNPFALMNASINDPSGLQDSLINVAKQFTYFDDETKSFKINRQGVLTLREMEKAAGLAQGSMSKMGLAAAELDERLSQISPSIKFENEEDKQYLANIGAMTTGGQYEVKFRDEKGIEQMRKLSEITQDEFDLLIDQQKDSNKPIEETAREQLTLQQTINNNIAAIKSLMMGVTLTSDVAMDVTEGLKQVADATARGAEKTTDIAELRKTANDASGDLREDLIEAIKGGKTSEAEIFAILAEGAVNIFGEVGKESMAQIGKASRQISEELKDEKNTYTAKKLSDSVGPILDGLSVLLTGDKAPTSDIPSGFGFSSSETAFPTGARTTGVTVGGIDPITPRGVSLPLPSREPIKVEFGPVPPIDLNFNGAPQNMTPQQIEEITKIFERLLQRQYIKNYLVDNTNESIPFQRGTPLGL
jgi:hypothetical protein